jgi:glycosyltransferase involved in cell wall biosynthesis
MSLRVGLVAPVEPQGRSSGVGRYIVSLTGALAALGADPDCTLPDVEFVVVTSPRNVGWVDPAVRDRMTVVTRTRPPDSFFEELGLDVVHVLVPRHVPTDRPTLFNPHFLGYLLYPELYRDGMIREWQKNIPAGCRQATIVDTPSQATKETVVEHYDIDPERVQPLPLGPSITADSVEDTPVETVRTRYDVPDSFALFPATTWPHKNHRRLVDALAHIGETYDETVPLVCTGNRETPMADPEHAVENLGSNAGVHDLGYVETAHLRALYHLSDLLVYPSLYETGGLPVMEGWAFDTPVVCSDIPPLRETGGDAVAYVDPTSVEDIGDPIHEVWTDRSRREQLVERGRDRREQFTWRRTARMYHALYRKAAGRELSTADRAALQYPDDGEQGG